MTTVWEPDPHRCGPNQWGMWHDAFWDQPGTVRECECGKTWVAYQDVYDPGYVGVKWRREGWLSKRRRVRSRCVRCGRAAHPYVRHPDCPRYVAPAPWWLRLATGPWAAGHDLAGRKGKRWESPWPVATCTP